MKISRRAALAAVGTPLAAPASEAPRRGVWIDPALAALPRRPWRKIHLDFHNSQHVKRIGERFNADEFGETLASANVDSVVVFAKDMHGYFYYPSRYGPVHPGLQFDLLGPQVEACRRRRIAVYAYYCVTWDHYLAAHHPEWLVLKRDGTSYLPKPDATPGWTALCIAREGFVKLVEDHTREFVSKYPLDGAWFDMPYPIGGECFCEECLKQLRGRGKDPTDRLAQREHKQELETRLLERLYKTVQGARPGCQVDFNNQAAYGLGERGKWMDNIDLEALPTTASWGYYYFPLVTRYTRTFGLTTYGMTGRFKSAWGDFGGLKLPAQLDVECASIVANAARCDIGDQMPPSARLDPAVYSVIGKAYGRIKALEPYLEGAAPVSEAALLIKGLPIDRVAGEALYGWVKLLTECRVQFDVVEPDAPWERYGLIVAPEDVAVDEALARRLRAYVANGGALVVSDRAGVLNGGSWLESYGLSYAGPSSFKPAYMIPKEAFTAGIPAYEYALYEGASQWRASGKARVVAQLGEPAFQRSPQHYTSHRQSPFDHESPYAAVAVSGKAALFAFPLGLSYYTEGYWVYRSALRHALETVLPEQMIRSDAPVSVELALTAQKSRYLVHVVNWCANRGTPRHPVFYEEPYPLTGAKVTLNLPVSGATVRAVAAGIDLKARKTPGGVEVAVPPVKVHEILVFQR
ncbi:MAG: alpha-amylase family protein [Bryobacteraceae bacterium]